MLISVRELVDRARYPRTRARDLAKLRARFQACPPMRDPGERDRALELQALKEEMVAVLDPVHACRGCAKGHPEPAGHWDGGHCCGGDTFRVFTKQEVRALKLAGTRPKDWVPPAGEQAGCAFRGPRGCSLAARHRPAICLRYICLELRAELRDEPRWARIGKLARRMESLLASLSDDVC